MLFKKQSRFNLGYRRKSAPTGSSTSTARVSRTHAAVLRCTAMPNHSVIALQQQEFRAHTRLFYAVQQYQVALSLRFNSKSFAHTRGCSTLYSNAKSLCHCASTARVSRTHAAVLRCTAMPNHSVIALQQQEFRAHTRLFYAVQQYQVALSLRFNSKSFAHTRGCSTLYSNAKSLCHCCQVALSLLSSSSVIAVK